MQAKQNQVTLTTFAQLLKVAPETLSLDTNKTTKRNGRTYIEMKVVEQNIHKTQEKAQDINHNRTLK